MKYTKEQYFEFFKLQFTKKKSGMFTHILILPNRGEVIAIDKDLNEMVVGVDTEWVYELNTKEQEFFEKNKEYCNQWIKLH